MASFEEVRQTIEQGIGYTEASAHNMNDCFSNIQLTGNATLAVKRRAGELSESNQQATVAVATTLGLARVALHILQPETDMDETLYDEPVLLTAAATLNKSFGILAMATVADKALTGDQGVMTMNALAERATEHANYSANAADKAYGEACNATAKYSEAKPEDQSTLTALAYQKQIKSLADDLLGNLVGKFSALREANSRTTLFSGLAEETVGALDMLEAIRDLAIRDTDVPATLERSVINDLNLLTNWLERIIDTRKLAQQTLGDVAVAASAILPVRRQAREQVLDIRRQPPMIIDQARSLIKRSI